MRRMIMAAVAAFIGGVGAAAAADLGGYDGSMKDEPVTAVYGPNWAGLYVGGSVGYGWGDVSETLSGTNFLDDVIQEERVFKDSDNRNSAVYGAHLGYNFQRGSIVFGPEISINGISMDSSSFGDQNLATQNHLNWYATAVGRLGYARDSFLLYGFGGVAWSKVETELTTTLPIEAKGDTTFVGWTAGVGVEYALSSNLALRLEYSHVDLGSETTFHERGDLGRGQVIALDNETDLAFDVIKIGASYRFGSRDEALK